MLLAGQKKAWFSITITLLLYVYNLYSKLQKVSNHNCQKALLFNTFLDVLGGMFTFYSCLIRARKCPSVPLTHHSIFSLSPSLHPKNNCIKITKNFYITFGILFGASLKSINKYNF